MGITLSCPRRFSQHACHNTAGTRFFPDKCWCACCYAGMGRQATVDLPDVALGSLVWAGVLYRSSLVFIVYNLPDACLYQQLRALVAWKHRHIHLLHPHRQAGHIHVGSVSRVSRSYRGCPHHSRGVQESARGRLPTRHS